ncbi:MAG: class I SAM-dependent methyltransferase [Candidatus Micrarchaeota archaeon]
MVSLKRPEFRSTPNYGALDEETYKAKINTPAKNPLYFERFHKPLVDRAAGASPSGKVVLLDVACGHALELDFFKDDLRVSLVGVDMDTASLASASRRLPGARFIAYDVRNAPPLPLPSGFADAGIALNAVVYVPERMLAALEWGLKPGAECSVNFRIYGNPFNRRFYEYYTERGAIIRDEALIVSSGGRFWHFTLAALDYSKCDDQDIRNLAVQLYFKSKKDAEKLVALAGLEIVNVAAFHFASPVNPDNEIEVYALRKSTA